MKNKQVLSFLKELALDEAANGSSLKYQVINKIYHNPSKFTQEEVTQLLVEAEWDKQLKRGELWDRINRLPTPPPLYGTK